MSDVADAGELSEMPLEALTACHECDLLMQKPELQVGESAHCPRCGYELYMSRPKVVKRSMALVIAALLLYFPANFLPIMELSLLGQNSTDTVWSGVLALYESGMQGVAVVVFLASMAVPLLKLVCQFLVLLSIQLKFGRSYGLLLYRIYHHMREWGMLEVYLMGTLVSVVKLIGLADITLGVGLACFVSLLLIQVWLEVTMTPHQIWDALSGEDDHAGH
ncbi:paraquat-inducible protein A [Pseudomonas sp. GV071]|jgi:paraquat-inducible protein A|uniref:paraquat-inducible protein A n=1 Tax=Pseudomonas sp. GV071 TaxID=2135754 RepID=UPI000D373AEF|nr:paraquat-inducible protein A [Pseudomonas sp. GV071]PTQ67830.1 paraquat-inducible protein A [Pseudomonas sp. GV071]